MFTCEPPHTCHRCNATRRDFLSTAVFPSKSSAARRRAVEQAAAGQGRDIRGMQAGGSVLDFGELPDRIHSPGPNASHYEQFRFEIKRAFVSLLWEHDEGRPGEKCLLSLLNTSKFIYIRVLYLNTTNFI
jgi:hypothetical protein